MLNAFNKVSDFAKNELIDRIFFMDLVTLKAAQAATEKYSYIGVLENNCL